MMEQLKRLLDTTSKQLDTTTRQLDVTSARLQLSEQRVQFLEEKLRLQRIAKYGPGSEKLTSLQLELLEFEPGVSDVEVAAESERDALPATPEKKKRKHPGRQTLPADLLRVERVIACTSEQCVCGGCGQATTLIGYEESEQLDVQPVKYFVLVTKREKRACKRCEERGVMAAPLPPRIIEKSLVSDQVIVDSIISKYSNHCPLYRQSVILLRDAGLDISRATIDGWVMRVGDLLMPLVAVMGRELVRGNYIQADETPVDVQTRDGRSRNHPGYLWQYGTPGGAAIFEFRMGRGRSRRSPPVSSRSTVCRSRCTGSIAGGLRWRASSTSTAALRRISIRCERAPALVASPANGLIMRRRRHGQGTPLVLAGICLGRGAHLRLHRMRSAGARANRDEHHPLLVARAADDQRPIVLELEVGGHHRARSVEQHDLHRDHVAVDGARLHVENFAAWQRERDHLAAIGLPLVVTD